MAAITSRTDYYKRMAEGKGYIFPSQLVNSSTGTAAVAASGHVSIVLGFGRQTTFPSTLEGIKVPPQPAGLRPTMVAHRVIQANAPMLGWFYEIGTLNLAATGDQFTHHAATFPLLRTQFGQASQPIDLIPILQITTATTTTAAVITLKTAAGGTGYVDTEGNNVVGTITFTMPAAATAVNSCFVPRLEDGDFGVRNIAAIQVNTAASAGAARLWGFEPICGGGSGAGTPVGHDLVYGGIGAVPLVPAVATSGTAAAYLGMATFGNQNTGGLHSFLMGVTET